MTASSRERLRVSCILGHAVPGGKAHTLGRGRGSGVMALFECELIIVARFVQVWAKDGGRVHPTHFLVRNDVAVYIGHNQVCI